jgi:HAE1 family hydrophobic/amphiphilic exporter-1
MNLSGFAVNRPIAVFMLFIGIVIFGLVGLVKLPVDLMPSFEFPMVSVVTYYLGAGSEDIETNVTETIEDALATISGVEHIDSVSQNNLSVVSVQFAFGTDLAEAASDIREQLDGLAMDLPKDIEPPVLVKMSSANIPILVMGATATENYKGLRHIMTKQVADRLRAVPGVAGVMVIGGPEREIQVRIDPGRLEATGVSMDQIVQVLQAENLDMPAGKIRIGWSDYTVRVPGQLTSAAELGRIVVGQGMGDPIHLRDVAEVEDSFAESWMEARADRMPGVVFFVSKQAGTNSVAVSKAALAKLDQIKKDLPPDVELFTFFDTSDFIQRAISNLSQAVYYGGLFVVLTVLFFLRRVRGTIVIALSIPISALAAFFVMYAAGYTLNIVTLMSLSIAVGMVVDAAIVVLENITRHVESGEKVREASMYGASEIGLAVAASAATTVVVFVPMLFVTGLTGVLFKQLALIIIVMISVSLFTALTLTPALTSTLMRREYAATPDSGRFAWFFKAGGRFLDEVDERYTRLLGAALRHKRRTVLVSLAIFVVTMALSVFVKSEFFPTPDSGEIEMQLEVSPGTHLERTMQILGELENFIVTEIPEREYLFSYAGEMGGWAIIQGEKEGTHVGRVGLQLVPRERRTRTSDEVGDLLRRKAQSMPDVVKANVRTGGSIGQFFGMHTVPISVQLKGQDLAELEAFGVTVRDAIREVPGAVDVELDIGDPRPEFHVIVDREKAASLGLNTYLIASALQTHISGKDATKIRDRGDEWDVLVRAPESDRGTIEDIMSLPIPSMTGRMVRLSSVADVDLGVGPTEIRHRDQERIVKVQGRLLGRPLGEVAGDVRKALADLDTPSNVSVDFGGDVEEQGRAFRDLVLLLTLSIALVYMVMAAQFESLVDPFIVMFSVPFGFVGVVWGLLISNTTLSLTSFLALIMLMGIVVNNAIILVDYTNTMRKRGMPLTDAVLISGRRRLRPVLMTTLTTIFGMVPLVMMRSSGSEVWRPMGVAMIGGLTVSTLVTLVLVPTIYTIFENRFRRFEEKKA